MTRRSTAKAPFSDENPPDGRRLVIVGIGTSAGGLEAATALLKALPGTSGMAFILIQHLDAGQKSLMVELLTRHTPMTVLEAADGMAIEADHLYVIPPGTYLSVRRGSLHLSRPPVPHRTRAPFDFLLESMAKAYGAQAGCIVLSGTGADGSVGLLAVKAAHGLVLVQQPDEAGSQGMPRSAIATGKADAILPVAGIVAALMAYRNVHEGTDGRPCDEDAGHADFLPEIIGLLRARTGQDFGLYKPGTLRRRIERRVSLTGQHPDDLHGYIERLRVDGEEVELLAKDLLINVTSFFRDRVVFDHLADTTIPALVDAHPQDQPLRVWVIGCSTGEETYSLAMLFIERIEASKRDIKLQVFGSDLDADAIAAARDGVFSEVSASALRPDRLSRFFSREPSGWRASPFLRSCIIFTVQDILANPPFVRLDMVSCRNLLIYLQPDAQMRVLKLCHFALREGGVLLLGSAENVVEADGLFETLVKPARIYRRISRSLTARDRSATDRLWAAGSDVASRAPSRPASPSLRPAEMAELGRNLIIDSYAPTSVLVGAANEMVFAVGSIDRYFRLPNGLATLDLLAMARPGLRAKLLAAFRAARSKRTLVRVEEHSAGDASTPVRLDIRPVPGAENGVLLVSFVDVERPATDEAASSRHQTPRVKELERELDATKRELHGAVEELELSIADQRVINEEALSVNEEYQSTNEELLASKEELQSLNEELTTLNSQLQETLERQRSTSDDLQNILYSTNVATLFLDLDLNIRFFTPETKILFALRPADIGRRLADLAGAAPDHALESEARLVIATLQPVEREIQTSEGIWFRRRILPYRTQGDQVEGLVITFTNITSKKAIAKALETAKIQAEVANAAKTRFLAAASHDLRQPLQSLALLQGLLARSVEKGESQEFVARIGSTLDAMGTMLDTMLDINQIEAGALQPSVHSIPINILLDLLHGEFAYQAQSKQLDFRVVRCSLTVSSDASLLAQMIRNMISNALKYTDRGGVLVGCRRRGDVVSIEVWDTGIGIDDADQETIFEEYHQVDNAARERSRGLGLGLSIVKRLGELLDHRVRVRSRRGKGSCFSVEVPFGAPVPVGTAVVAVPRGDQQVRSPLATILIVEDDPDLLEFLGGLLARQDLRILTAADGTAALGIAAREGIDLVLADYNLPNGPNGVELADAIRDLMVKEIPVIILTGDISNGTARSLSKQKCIHLKKPVRAVDLIRLIEQLLSRPDRIVSRPVDGNAAMPCVIVVDDDELLRESLIAVIEQQGWTAHGYASGEAFLAEARPEENVCLLLDASLPGIDGVSLLVSLREAGSALPAIVITGQSDVAMAVRAMRAGAFDFVEKPIEAADLLGRIGHALERSQSASKRGIWQHEAATRIAGLTSRQREIMELVLAGQPSKNIAADLGISRRTVENHRATIMHKTGSASVPALVRLALASVPVQQPN